MNKKKLVSIIQKVASRVVERQMKRQRKAILNEVRSMLQGQSHSQPVDSALQERSARRNSRQAVRDGFQQQQGQQQQNHNQQQGGGGWGNAQPAGDGDPRSAFKQIQEQQFQGGQGGGRGGNMSEKEMIQYAESIDPASNLGEQGTLSGDKEDKQQFMQNLQRATGGKDPSQILESSTRRGGDWRPGMDDE